MIVKSGRSQRIFVLPRSRRKTSLIKPGARALACRSYSLLQITAIRPPPPPPQSSFHNILQFLCTHHLIFTITGGRAGPRRADRLREGAETEQVRRRSNRVARSDTAIAASSSPAAAGFPGAWDEIDDDYDELPSAAARGGARPSGSTRSGQACTWASGGRAILGGHPGGVAQLAERYVRNVEAEGSSPFTSTISPGQRAKVGAPQKPKRKGGRRGFARGRPRVLGQSPIMT